MLEYYQVIITCTWEIWLVASTLAIKMTFHRNFLCNLRFKLNM